MADNIAFGLNLKKMDKDVIEKKVSRMLELVGLKGFEKRDVTLLSGGQQQRVAIAEPLLTNLRYYFLMSLWVRWMPSLEKICRLSLKRFRRKLELHLFCYSRPGRGTFMSDTIVVLNDGVIQQIGTPMDIYNEPQNRFVAEFIGESNIIEGNMIKDCLVNFDGIDWECVDKGFKDNEDIEVVLRPEDMDVVEPEAGKVSGTIISKVFYGCSL